MKDSNRVCAYCGKHEVKARGLCNACYIRLQRHGDCKYRRHKTNADRIRAMTDEDLAKSLAEISDCVACETMFDMKCRCHHEFFSCWQAWLDWLKKEATNDQNNS